MEDEQDGDRPKIGLDVKLILAVLTFHALVMLTAMIPNASYAKQLITPALNKYSSTTRSTHKWAMFETVPQGRKFSCVIEATDSEGNVHEFGPVLPGFQPYSDSFHQRSFFTLFVYPGYRTSYKQYVESMTRALAEIEEPEIVAFSLRQDIHAVGSLAQLRESKEFPEMKQVRYGPHYIPQSLDEEPEPDRKPLAGTAAVTTN